MTFDLAKVGETMQGKVAKVGTGIAAGGSSLILITSMLNGRLDEINKRIDEKDRQIREFVELRHDQVTREIKYMNDGQREIKDLLRLIEARMYRTKKGRDSDG